MTLEQRAQKAREELFARYDHLNALWLKAEEELTRLHIPRPVTHVYAKYDLDWREPHFGQTRECLGLQKVKGKWCLCYGSFDDVHSAPEPVGEWTPITDCSAEIRVAAARHLPGLRKAVVESAEKFIPQVDSAIEALAKSLGQDDELAKLLAERAKLNGRQQ